MVFVALLGLAAVAYWSGTRSQRYVQARADVKDTQGKLRKARDARSALRQGAIGGWLVVGAVAVLAGLVVAASAQK